MKPRGVERKKSGLYKKYKTKKSEKKFKKGIDKEGKEGYNDKAVA